VSLPGTAHANEDHGCSGCGRGRSRGGSGRAFSTREFDTRNFESNLGVYFSFKWEIAEKDEESNLVLQIIPPVGPCLLNAAFLLNDCVGYDSTEDAERHRNAVVVVAVYARATGEGVERATVYFKPIIQLFGLDPEFSYELYEHKVEAI
jgi:hypothetical protein